MTPDDHFVDRLEPIPDPNKLLLLPNPFKKIPRKKKGKKKAKK